MEISHKKEGVKGLDSLSALANVKFSGVLAASEERGGKILQAASNKCRTTSCIVTVILYGQNRAAFGQKRDECGEIQKGGPILARRTQTGGSGVLRTSQISNNSESVQTPHLIESLSRPEASGQKTTQVRKNTSSGPSGFQERDPIMVRPESVMTQFGYTSSGMAKGREMRLLFSRFNRPLSAIDGPFLRGRETHAQPES